MTGVGVAGLGRIGRLHAGNLARGIAGLRLVAVADISPEAAEGVDAPLAADAQALLDDAAVEALVVCTPARTHADLIVAAAEAGKHVFCEKPLALDLADADRAVAAAGTAGIVLQVGFNRRFDRQFAAAREAIAGGAIGEPELVRITSRDPAPPGPEFAAASGGLLLDTTGHDFDLARFLLDDDIVEVSALAAADEESAVVTVRFASGALGAIDNSYHAAYGYDQRVEVLGSRGLVSCDNVPATTTALADAAGFHRQPLPYFFPDRYAEAYVRELECFAGAIAGGAAGPTGEDGRRALLASLAARRSLLERRAVRLDELER